MPKISDPQEIKKKQILAAAYQRFSHYGYAKTTMNEIAKDLSFSKALLYYYFPDKSQLYAGVIRKLTADYLTALKHKAQRSNKIEDVFFFILQKKHETITNHYNFFDYIKINQQNLPDLIWEIIENVNQTEIDLLTESYRKQVSEDFAASHDLNEIIGIIFKALDSIHLSTKKNKISYFPDSEQLEIIYVQKKLLLQIMLNGLKSL